MKAQTQHGGRSRRARAAGHGRSRGPGGKSAGELAGGPGRSARSAHRNSNVAQQVRAEAARDHRIQYFTDTAVSRMSPRAETQAGPAPHNLLSAVDHRLDLRTVRHFRKRLEGRPNALQRISHRLPDSPANLGQSVGEFGIPVIAHSRILPPGGREWRAGRSRDDSDRELR